MTQIIMMNTDNFNNPTLKRGDKRNAYLMDFSPHKYFETNKSFLIIKVSVISVLLYIRWK